MISVQGQLTVLSKPRFYSKLLLFLMLSASQLYGQSSIVTGKVYNAINGDPLPYATVAAEGTALGTVTDSAGRFTLGLPAGVYNIAFSYTGFADYVEQEVLTSNVRPVVLDVGMEAVTAELTAITIESEGFKRTPETPLSLRTFSYAEAQRMPGAILDLSKVIQSYPGVLPKSTFGYNIVIRGGNSSENAYFLDGIPIPSITHFNVQGASGGPNGLINLDFVRNIDLYTAAFPAARGGALSGVMEIHQRDGRSDRLGARLTLGATDVGATLEGPMGERSNYIVSGRYSFSQYLLRAIGVPVLPTYSDFQYRQRIRLDEKNELVLVAIGASDIYRLNTEAEESDALLYNIGYIPEGDQQQFTGGINYKHYLQNSYYNVIVSHTSFNNNADKFRNNSELEEDRLLRYRSGVGKQHFRVEQKIFFGENELMYGIVGERLAGEYDIFGYNVRSNGIDTADGINSLDLLSYGFFVSAGRNFFGGKLVANGGIRGDANNFNSAMGNPIDQLSPRLALSWRVNEQFSVNGSTGIYYQQPDQIIMAFADANTADELLYMRSPQVALGVEHRNADHYRVSIEGFYKQYNDYPFLLTDSIAYANAIADYVVVGNQPAASIGEGRAYGMEVYVQQKLRSNYWWMASYTYSVSEFLDKDGNYRPSVWDSRHFISLTAGKTWGKGWQVGARWRYSSGTPYTPYDTVTSSLISNWEVANRGIFDYERLNESRLPSFHVLDVRLDKRWAFAKSNLNVFLDIQNAYRSGIALLPYLTTVNDADFNPVVNAEDPSRYDLQLINSDTGRTLTTLGLVMEF